jgi:curved DNA-binding protein CbpA
MNEILKRLELIKTGIEINDTEIIELQIKKLKLLSIENEVHKILTKLKRNDYGQVVVDIENYIAQFNGIVVYKDKEVQGLKFELKVLEKQFQELSNTKNEHTNDIEEFNTVYRLKLGKLISKILEREKEMLHEQTIEKEKTFEEKREEYEQIKDEYKDLKAKKEALEKELDEIDEFDDAYDDIYEELQELKEEMNRKEKDLNEKRKEAKQAKEEMEDDPARQGYKEAENDYEEFCNDYIEVLNKKRYEITDEEKLELKQLYRKAVKLCHPDIVTDELKEQAKNIIQKLNDAYTKRDLLKVKEIMLSLKSGKSFDTDSDTINDKEILKEKIVEMRQKITDIELEIGGIKTDETFQTIQKIDDWNVYFEEMEEALQKQYEHLLNTDRDESLSETQTVDSGSRMESTDDAYWESLFRMYRNEKPQETQTEETVNSGKSTDDAYWDEDAPF